MSATPRTDADAIWANAMNGEDFQCVHVDFARELEAENQRLQAENAELRRELEEARKANQAELYQLRSQNEVLLGIYDAAVNLEKVKCRHHTEIAYQRLISSIDAARQ